MHKGACGLAGRWMRPELLSVVCAEVRTLRTALARNFGGRRRQKASSASVSLLDAAFFKRPLSRRGGEEREDGGA